MSEAEKVVGGASTTGRRSNLFDFGAQLGATVIGRGAYLGLQVMLARLLGPAEFGLYALGWSLLGLISTISPIGMPQAALRFRVGGRGALISLAMLLTLTVGAATGVTAFAAADALATRLFGSPAVASVIRAFSSAIPTFGILIFMTAALRTSGAIGLSAVIGALPFIVYLGLVAIQSLFFTISATAAAYLYTVAIVGAMVAATAALLSYDDPNEPSPRLFALARFGVITMLIHSANVLNLSVDRLIVGILVDPVQVGIYQIASQLALAGMMIRNAIDVVFESNVAKIGTRHGIPDLSKEFYSAWRLLLHASAPGLIALAVTSHYWIRFLFGPSFSAAATPLAILAFGQVAATLAGPSLICLHMSGRERTVMQLTTGTALLNIAGCFVLVPFLGSSGAALASVIANLTVSVLSLGYCLTSGRLMMQVRAVRDVFIALPVCALSLYAMDAAWGKELTLLGALGMALSAYLIYAAMIAAFCTTNDEILTLVYRRLGLATPRRLEG